MPLFYHKYVNYVLAHSVNYVITLYRLGPPVALIHSRNYYLLVGIEVVFSVVGCKFIVLTFL